MNGTHLTTAEATASGWGFLGSLGVSGSEKLFQTDKNLLMLGLWAILSLAFAYFVSLAIYRIYFHPLSKYPGPLLCKLTSLVWTYHFSVGDIIKWNDDLHTKYGETVRLGPNRLSFITPRAWKDIYGHKHGKYTVTPLPLALPNSCSRLNRSSLM